MERFEIQLKIQANFLEVYKQTERWIERYGLEFQSQGERNYRACWTNGNIMLGLSIQSKRWTWADFFEFKKGSDDIYHDVVLEGMPGKVLISDNNLQGRVWCKNTIHSQKPKRKVACNNRG